MKKYCRLVLVVMVILSSCSSVRYNKIYNYDDEFRGNSRKLVRISIKPEERRTEIGVARVVFEKVRSSVYEEVNAYFVISRSSSSFKADEKCFVKVGGKHYELQLFDHKSEYRSVTEVGASGFSFSDSVGAKSLFSSDVDTRTWVEDKFIIKLSGEVLIALSGAGEVFFRFYFGPIQGTYRFKGRKLCLLKSVSGH